MSEPYDGDTCPCCDSTDTLSWTLGTAYWLGFGSECRTCRTRWDFPAASDIHELDRLARHCPFASILAYHDLPAPGGKQP